MRRSLAGVAVGAVAIVAAAVLGGCESSKTGSAGTAATTSATVTSGSSASSSSVTSPSVSKSTMPPQPSSTLPRCPDGQLNLALKPLPGAASGHTFWDIILTNHGPACSFSGYPKIAVLGPDRKPITIPVSNAPGLTILFTLAPGASAAETLKYGTDGNPPCGPKTSFIQVTPPGTTVPFRDQDFCAHDSITLSAFVAGDYSPPF